MTRLLGGGLAALTQRVLLPDLHGHFFRIKNAHAAKFYLVCKSWDPTNPGDTTPGGRFTIEELRSWLWIPEGEYRHTPHLKSAILDRAKAELDEAADGSFEYEPFRQDGVIAGWNRWSTTRSVGVRPNAASNRRCQPLQSPKNSKPTIEKKAATYFGAGVREVWICDRKGQMCRCFATARRPAPLTRLASRRLGAVFGSGEHGIFPNRRRAASRSRARLARAGSRVRFAQAKSGASGRANMHGAGAGAPALCFEVVRFPGGMSL